MSEGTHAGPRYGRLAVGLAVTALGVAFTLDNLHIVDVSRFWDLLATYWPLVLVAVGISYISRAQTWAGYLGGLVWMLAGAWLLGESLGFIDVSLWALWPLALVAFGGWILMNGLIPGRPGTNTAGAATDTVGAVAVMSGVTRRSVSQDFRGGDVVAFMGGASIDLRGAQIASGEARLEVFAMWGGIDVFVPEGWLVDNRAFPLMGGVDDHTERPTTGDAPRLVIRGFILMGGMDIKHGNK